jgi:N-carbamoyl-L-amino-acid hydrolase
MPLAPAVVESLDELARIGASPDGGVTRLAWSPELFAAYDWVGQRMRALGLAVEVDPAGNLIGRWDVGEGAPVVVGSHLDTVPSGGRLDGALGVVGAVHAVAVLQRRGHRPARPLGGVAFLD